MAGRVFAITGAFGVLGSAVAKAAAEAGARLALIDFAKAAPPACPSGAGGPGAGRRRPDRRRCGRRGHRRASPSGSAASTSLLNIAGGFSLGDAGGRRLAETWHRLFLMNVQTAANASRAAIPHLKRSAAGRIVNVGANGGAEGRRSAWAPMRPPRPACTA